MNIGIVIGVLSVIIALVMNYMNLYTMYDGNEKVKHYLINYYIGWIIAIIPFAGLLYQIIWFSIQTFVLEYSCKSIFFREV